MSLCKLLQKQHGGRSIKIQMVTRDVKISTTFILNLFGSNLGKVWELGKKYRRDARIRNFLGDIGILCSEITNLISKYNISTRKKLVTEMKVCRCDCIRYYSILIQAHRCVPPEMWTTHLPHSRIATEGVLVSVSSHNPLFPP